MAKSYFSPEGGAVAMPGAESKTITKSWRDMTQADWDALKEHGIEAVQTEVETPEHEDWRQIVAEGRWDEYVEARRAELRSEDPDLGTHDESGISEPEDDGLALA